MKKAVLIIAAIELAGYALFATAAPMWEFDFLSNWGLKAKVFALHGGIDWEFLQHAWYRNTHPDYPPLVPLAFDAFALMRGGWDDRWIGLFYPLIALAMTWFTFRIAREEVGELRAAIVAVILCPLFASPWPGLADGWMAAFAFAAMLLLRRGDTTLAAVFLGLAAMTKNEGLTLIVAAACALLATKRARDIVRLWPAIVLAAPWLILRAVHHIPGDLTSGSVWSRVAERIAHPDILLTAFRGAAVGKPMMWLGIIAGIVIGGRRQRFLLVGAGVQLLFYFAAYLASPHDLNWHVRWSWERLVSHVAPLFAYAVLIELMAKVPSEVEAPAERVANDLA